LHLAFLLQIIKFEEIKNCLYIIVYNDLYIIKYEQFFLISSNLIICKRNDAKIILLIFCFLIIIIFLISNSNFTKERKMNLYGHISYIIIYVYIYLYIFLYEKFVYLL